MESTALRLAVKWRTRVFPDIEAATEQTVETLRAQLFSLTGVEPSRQKLLLRGAVLKDGAVLGDYGLRAEDTLLMLGAPAADVPTREEPRPEAGEARAAEPALEVPGGLANLINTCYANATLQFLHAVPPLCEALRTSNPAGELARATKAVLGALDRRQEQPVVPAQFLRALWDAHPSLAERTGEGLPQQQDAEECLSALVAALGGIATESVGGELVCTTTCLEAEEEPLVASEPFVKMDCHIGSETGHLAAGLEASLRQSLEKTSPTLHRMARYEKSGRISTLPPFLVVNFLRFFWKQREKVKAKILKRVAFPLDLDLHALCTADLQAALRPAREAEGGGQFAGRYRLKAVLTHMGRTADSGHYMAWVRSSERPAVWWKLDDHRVTRAAEADILKLQGGGDWHAAYLCLYEALGNTQPAPQ